MISIHINRLGKFYIQWNKVYGDDVEEIKLYNNLTEAEARVCLEINDIDISTRNDIFYTFDEECVNVILLDTHGYIWHTGLKGYVV